MFLLFVLTIVNLFFCGHLQKQNSPTAPAAAHRNRPVGLVFAAKKFYPNGVGSLSRTGPATTQLVAKRRRQKQSAETIQKLRNAMIKENSDSGSSDLEAKTDSNSSDSGRFVTKFVFGPQRQVDSYQLLPGRGMHHLLRKIFSSYDKEVMPARPVIIHMDVLLLKVKSTVEKEGIFESEWNDIRMSWEPTDYEDNVTILAFDSDKVWLPDIAMTNSADHLYSISRDHRFVVRVAYDGTFKFVPTGTARTWCELKLPTFPFDIQTCSLEFESWALDSKTMTFDGHSHLLIDESFASQQWSLCSYKAVTYDHLYEFTGETFTRVRFDFTVKRKSMFYVLILIFPSTLLSLIQLLVFMIPSDETTADRIGFGTTNLLTLVVFQTIVTEEMPKSSDAVTSLSKYIIALIIIAAIGIFESVAVERLMRITAYPPPKVSLQLIDKISFIVKYLPKKMFSCCKNENSSDVESSNSRPDLMARYSLKHKKYHSSTTPRSAKHQTDKTGCFGCLPNRRNLPSLKAKTTRLYLKQNKFAIANSYQSNEDVIVDAVACRLNGDLCSPPSYREHEPQSNYRRNSYLSALSRDRSSSFIVKLMKNKVANSQSVNIDVSRTSSIHPDEAIIRSKSDFDHFATVACKPPAKARRPSELNVCESDTSSRQLSSGLSYWKPDGKKSNPADAKKRRNSKQWIRLTRFLDVVTFFFCGIFALMMPVVLFLPLVYFDDKCGDTKEGLEKLGFLNGNITES